MGKSIRARAISGMLRLLSAYARRNSGKMYAAALRKGEVPTPSPKAPKTRFEDHPSGRVFYANEDGEGAPTVFYLHGGAYFMGFSVAHWMLMEKIIAATDAQVIAPAYRLLPFATWREAFDLIVPLYRAYREANPDRKVILMGDSAGGGLAVSLTEQFKEEGTRLPDELVLLSPWVDIATDNDEIAAYESIDSLLVVEPLQFCAERWRGELDVRDWRVSPIYGDLRGIRNVTVFVGSNELFYPDITRFYGLLDEDPSNMLVVGEQMEHVYPLYPIPEAKPAIEKILRVIMR